MFTKLPQKTIMSSTLLLEQALQSVNGLKAAVLTSADGLIITQVGNDTKVVDRLGAMGSSISALSQMIGVESNLGSNEAVIIEAEEGYLVVLQILHDTYPMSLTFVAERKAILGQVLFYAKSVVKAIKLEI